jgi:hypothetical protein
MRGPEHWWLLCGMGQGGTPFHYASKHLKTALVRAGSQLHIQTDAVGGFEASPD